MREFIIFSMLIVLILVPSSAIPSTFHNSKARLHIEPQSIRDESLVPCSNITFTIKISNVINLYAYEFKVYFKNSVLTATKAVRPRGHFLEPVEPTNQFVAKWEIKNNFNTTHGRIWLGFTLLSPEIARSGNGTLVEITFHVEGVGTTMLILKDTKLADDTGSAIIHDVENALFSNAPPPPPPAPAVICVDPERVVNPDLTPSRNFTVDVVIISALDLYAFSFKLAYNPSVLKALEIMEGSFLSNVGSTSVLIKDIDNTQGYLRFSVKLLSPPGASGNGTLATIKFHVLKSGATPLRLYETDLTNSENEPLPHSTKEGYFTNIIFAKLFVDPPEIIDPKILPGDTFPIDIKIENVQNLYSYEFFMSYDAKVLTCIQIHIHFALNETNFTAKFSADDELGVIFVKVSYYSPAKPISTIPPVSLVTITFKVDVMGATNLTLYDTKLLDMDGNPIPHETGNGFFQSVIRDVAVIYVAPGIKKIYEGWTVNITVIVKNEGDLSEIFNVTLYREDIAITTQTIINLAPNKNVTFIFKWDTKGLPPCTNYTLKAKAWPVPYETDLEDNMYIDGAVKIKMMGDLNDDRVVNIFDLTIAAMAFGSRPGDSNWNPEADLDQNGIIDLYDLVRITINYGRTC